MVDTFVVHKNHPTHRSECPSLTKFNQESTVHDIQAYIESSVELSVIDSYNYEIHIYNRKYRKYVMLEQKYLDGFTPFQCNNIVSGEEATTSAVESHTDYYVDLEVIWSIKKNNGQIATEQILYQDEREFCDHLPHNYSQMPSYEAEPCSDTTEASSVSTMIDSAQPVQYSNNNGVSPSDLSYQTSSIDPDTTKQDSTLIILHDKDSILSSPVTNDPKNCIDALVLSTTDEKTSSEQCSDVAYISTESQIQGYSTIGRTCTVSPVSKFPETIVYDTNTQMNSLLPSTEVYSTNSKSNVCQLSSATTDENFDSKTKGYEDFCMKPCFTETDCDEIYRTARKGPEIGRGTYGTVSSYLTKTKKLIAVKEIRLDNDDSERFCGDFEWVQEVYILRQLDHPYVVKFYGISIENTRLVKIFMEYLPNGTIAHMLLLFGPFHNNVLQKYTRQIVNAVAYLHDEGVIHRDIKGDNVMLDKHGNIRLIDFGSAERLKENPNMGSMDLMSKSMKGTLNWMAPEVLTETGHGEKADIWSIGCTLFEMATGKPPWSSEDNKYSIQIIIAHGTKSPDDLPERCQPEAQEFFRSCLTRDPNLRPSADDLLYQAFLNS